jgi:ABC-type cobalamin transport system ATPase subunit
MVRHIGLNPVPDDVNLESFLVKIMEQNDEQLEKFIDELHDTVKETMEAGQPFIFSYGKLLNYLAREDSVTQPWLINAFSVAVWKLMEADL